MKNKEKKTEFRYFTIPQWKQEEDYLRQQHKNGWKFTNVSFLGVYHFEKCEPEDVVYQLDYNQEGIANKEEYTQMFRDCGWEYLQDFVGYSYFRKPAADMKEEEEIFCDDVSRMDMMKRVFKGRMIPLLIIFFCCIIPNMLLQNQIEGTFHNILTTTFGILFLIYLALFLTFGYQFWKCWKILNK